MVKCKSCGRKVEFGERISFAKEGIKKVCEECFDRLMREKGYDIHIKPEGYKIYIFDDGVKYREYIPRGPAFNIIPSKDEIDIREKMYLDILNRKLEITARRLENKSN